MSPLCLQTGPAAVRRKLATEPIRETGKPFLHDATPIDNVTAVPAVQLPGKTAQPLTGLAFARIQSDAQNTHQEVYDVRTNIVLDDELVAAAMRISNARTKREVVDRALRTLRKRVPLLHDDPDFDRISEIEPKLSAWRG